MGRSPCCEKVGLKKGPWTPEEDQKLLAYIDQQGHGSWRALPTKAGLQRCGKSCRLRWINYLRPDIKRGKFSLQEEQTIIQLHALLGNRWSAIATHLPKRTDNEIKNYWNTHLKKKLAKSGIDPVTHKPETDALILSNEGQSRKTTKLSHMAQWESTRLEAEARLIRQSKLGFTSFHDQLHSPAKNFSAVASATLINSVALSNPPPCLDILKAWKGRWSTKPIERGGCGDSMAGLSCDLKLPTATLSVSENAPPVPPPGIGSCEDENLKEEGEEDTKGIGNSILLPEFKVEMENSMPFMTGFHEMSILPIEDAWTSESLGAGNETNVNSINFVERFTELLLNNFGDRSFSEGGVEFEGDGNSGSDDGEKENYWNSVLDLVNSSPSDSPML